MQCRNCGSQQPEGVAFCQQCGAPVSPPPPPSLAPTVMASPPSPGSSGANYDPLAPTVMASPPSPGSSGANYGPLAPTVAVPPPSYGSPAPYADYNPSSVPGSGQAYDTVQNPYSNVPYGQPQSGSVPPYGQSQPGGVPAYAPPPPNNISAYTPPSQGQNASYGGAGVPTFAGPPPVKRKSKVGLIVGIVIVVLLFVCVGSTVAVVALAHLGNSTSTPSGNPIDSTAALIVTNIQMASAIDANTYQPTTLATNFQTNSDIYVSFQFNLANANVTRQNPAYVQARYYAQNTRVDAPNAIIKVDDTIDPNGYAYFQVQYDQTTTAGAVELYWCRRPSCPDGALAGVATFTVS